MEDKAEWDREDEAEGTWKIKRNGTGRTKIEIVTVRTKDIAK